MTHETIQVDDRKRSYEHFAPSIRNAHAPLLLALHGTSQKGLTMQKFSGRTLDALAERIGADLVYLNGHHRAWNDARRIKISAAQKRNIDDLGFVRAVVTRYDRPTIGIGYSNGGQLLHRVLRESPGSLVGAVMMSAGLPVADDFTLVGIAPDVIPVLLFHGTADPIVPFDGGATKMLGRTRGTVESARVTAESYAHDVLPTVSRNGEIERADWGRVRQVTQFGVGHVIPNRITSPAPRFVGPSHHDLDTGEEIEEFFALSSV
jgi:polyhydroxybutyrate depolymerase